MWSPWQTLADEFPDWSVRFGVLPDGFDGLTDFRRRTIWIDQHLGRAARRSTLAHELEHVRRGHDGECCTAVEVDVEQTAARNLIPLERLGDVLMWTHLLDEAAEELDVDTAALAVRLGHLHPAERTYLRERRARREETA